MAKRKSILEELGEIRRAATALYTQRHKPIAEKEVLWEALRQALNLPKDDAEEKVRS